jgi:hypothetical protein
MHTATREVLERAGGLLPHRYPFHVDRVPELRRESDARADPQAIEIEPQDHAPASEGVLLPVVTLDDPSLGAMVDVHDRAFHVMCAESAAVQLDRESDSGPNRGPKLRTVSHEVRQCAR